MHNCLVQDLLYYCRYLLSPTVSVPSHTHTHTHTHKILYKFTVYMYLILYRDVHWRLSVYTPVGGNSSYTPSKVELPCWISECKLYVHYQAQPLYKLIYCIDHDHRPTQLLFQYLHSGDINMCTLNWHVLLYTLPNLIKYWLRVQGMSISLFSIYTVQRSCMLWIQRDKYVTISALFEYYLSMWRTTVCCWTTGSSTCLEHRQWWEHSLSILKASPSCSSLISCMLSKNQHIHVR